jgi:hypothetical protein
MDSSRLLVAVYYTELHRGFTEIHRDSQSFKPNTEHRIPNTALPNIDNWPQVVTQSCAEVSQSCTEIHRGFTVDKPNTEDRIPLSLSYCLLSCCLLLHRAEQRLHRVLKYRTLNTVLPDTEHRLPIQIPSTVTLASKFPPLPP